MTAQAAAPMPPEQAAAFQAAYASYRDAVDPHGPWANSRLSAAVTSALAAGWSARAIGVGLGIERKRVPVIAAHAPVEQVRVPAPTTGAPLPDAVVRTFRRHEDAVNLRRLTAERYWLATVRAARAAGWSCSSLGALVGISGERIRSLSGLELDVRGVQAPAFDRPARAAAAPAAGQPARPALTEQERERMRVLAGLARRAKSAPSGVVRSASSLKARSASEELSGLIVAAAGRGVRWPELDAACGYARGGARARAARHGYGSTWPSVAPYRKNEDIDPAAHPPARKEA